MTNYGLEILVRENKNYTHSFENNPWFNKSIMALLSNHKDVIIVDMFDIIHRLSLIINDISQPNKLSRGGEG